MWASLTDKLPNLPMGVTAENLAEKYALTREDHSQMTSAERGREGGYPNSDAVREVA